MITTDAIAFVLTQVKPRLRFLNDIEAGDWARAVERTDSDTALRIIRALVEDPDARLTIKEFTGRLPKPTRQQAIAARPAEPFEGYVRCLEAPAGHPEWEDRQWVTCIPMCMVTNRRAAEDWLRSLAKEIEQREGGRWCGILACGLADDGLRGRAARAEAERRILDGPDTPGRRFLLRLRGKPAGQQPKAGDAKDHLSELTGILDRSGLFTGVTP